MYKLKENKIYNIPILIFIVIVTITLLNIINVQAAEDNELFKYNIKDNIVEIKGINEDVSELFIPNKIKGKVVTSIKENAFKNNSNIKSVTLPITVNSIGKGAFKGCNLDYIVIPKEVSNISVNSIDAKKIYGVKNSQAYIYAEKNNIKFEEIDDFNISKVIFDNDSPLLIGNKVKIHVSTIGGKDEVNIKVTIKKDEESYNLSNFEWIPNATGTYEVIVEASDSINRICEYSCDFIIYEELNSLDVITEEKDKYQIGKEIEFNIESKGGLGNKLYNISCVRDGLKTYESGFIDTNKLIWNPNEVGEYEVTITARDSSGKTICNTTKYSIVDNYIINSYSVDTLPNSNKLMLSMNVSGGDGALQYRFIIKQNDKVIYDTKYQNRNAYKWNPGQSGKYKIYFKVKDGTGKELYSVTEYEKN